MLLWSWGLNNPGRAVNPGSPGGLPGFHLFTLGYEKICIIRPASRLAPGWVGAAGRAGVVVGPGRAGDHPGGGGRAAVVPLSDSITPARLMI